MFLSKQINAQSLYDQFLDRIQKTDLRAFEERFIFETDCVQFLYDLKFPHGFHCPRCGHHDASLINSRRLPLYQCRCCRHQTSLTADTIMEKSRTPLSKWLIALFLVSNLEMGVNAVHLSKYIAVSYKTAYQMLSQIRHAISNLDKQQPLTGVVKALMGVCNHQPNDILDLLPQEKPFLIAASFDEEHHPTYVKMKLISNEPAQRPIHLGKSEIIAFKKQHIQAEPEKVTFLKWLQFKEALPLKQHMDQVTQGFIRTYRALGYHHLQSYMDEACYRINLNLQGEPVFEHLSLVCMTTKRLTPTSVIRSRMQNEPSIMQNEIA